MTSAIASFDRSMPPSTLCSAATSCGGVRPNSPRGPLLLSSSARDTAPPFVVVETSGCAGLFEHMSSRHHRHIGAAASRYDDGRRRLATLQTPLWDHLGTTWGQTGDNRHSMP